MLKLVIGKQLEGFSLQTHTQLGNNQEELFLIRRICAIILLEKTSKAGTDVEG